jgi:Putative beta barrel porin-7 (BBP7)
VAINGFTIQTPPGGPAETGVGGLLTQSSNIGDYERNELSVLPQLGVTGGYMVTDRLKLTGGYSFVYWSRVVRPGDQIDLEVNLELLPFGPGGDGIPSRPQFVFRDTDFWAHGINAGIEYQW